MTEPCAFCDRPLNPYDEGVWKQVYGYVGGPKKDHMVLRTDTGKYAHNACVQAAKMGQMAGQADLFEAAESEALPSDAQPIILEDL